VIEFFRGDDIRCFLFGVSTSQWISILILAAIIYRTFITRKPVGDTSAGR